MGVGTARLVVHRVRHGVEISLRSPLVDSTVVGVSSPARLLELARLSEEAIPDAFWSRLDALGPAPSPIHDPAVR